MCGFDLAAGPVIVFLFLQGLNLRFGEEDAFLGDLGLPVDALRWSFETYIVLLLSIETEQDCMPGRRALYEMPAFDQSRSDREKIELL